ncbi:hypothetical protein CDD83_3500 [Cordyceps sp. RAO-2017]|nr:hypothetical protein CDD83_3500 [Cordyceps sp. RAO-2017]
MQKTLWPNRRCSPSAGITTAFSRFNSLSRTNFADEIALAAPSFTTANVLKPASPPHSFSLDRAEFQWRPPKNNNQVNYAPTWKIAGSPGPARDQHTMALSNSKGLVSLRDDAVEEAIKHLHTPDTEFQSHADAIESWQRFSVPRRSPFGSDDTWKLCQSIRGRNLLSLLEAETFRNEVLAAAFKCRTRVATVAKLARQLHREHGFLWPNLYAKAIHHCLRHGRFTQAALWHEHLAPTFLPQTEALGALISCFVIDPSPQMQSNLVALYVSSMEHRLYDHIIPALFSSGNSKLARTWRRKLVAFKDFPTTSKSRPFLVFMASYYPSIRLTREEICIADLQRQAQLDSSICTASHASSFRYSVRRTRLFHGVNWALGSGLLSKRLNALLKKHLLQHKMHKVGLVLDRMGALRLGVAHGNAAKLLQRTFARISEHPMEWSRVTGLPFTNTLGRLHRAIQITRRLARHDVAIPLRYWKLILLNLGRLRRFAEMEQVCMEVVQIYARPPGGLIPVHRQNWPKIVSAETAKKKVVSGEARYEGGETDTASARTKRGGATLLHSEDEPQARCVQQRLSLPAKPDEGMPGHDTERTPCAINVNHPSSGLMCSIKDRGGLASHDAASQPEMECLIPSDLPFTHREHPIQKLFDPHLQRSIVRWGFDHALAAQPSDVALMDLPFAAIQQSDVACGVRLLAALRNHGVLIDPQIVRAALISRIATAQVPGRRRHRSRDEIEMTVENLKKTIDMAWGSEILPDVSNMLRGLEKNMSKLRKRYSKLIGRALGQDT